ncbi:MAG: hypothetical protein ACLQGP_07950 [Isosphaeraceae bacterium]
MRTSSQENRGGHGEEWERRPFLGKTKNKRKFMQLKSRLCRSFWVYGTEEVATRMEMQARARLSWVLVGSFDQD